MKLTANDVECVARHAHMIRNDLSRITPGAHRVAHSSGELLHGSASVQVRKAH
jgi:hypothetical protein